MRIDILLADFHGTGEALGRYIPKWDTIEIYLNVIDENLAWETLATVHIHEIIHWQLDLSGEPDYKNENKVRLAEEKLTDWVIEPDLRFRILKKLMEKIGW